MNCVSQPVYWKQYITRWLTALFGLVAMSAFMVGCAGQVTVCTLEVQGHVQSLATSGSALIGDFLGNKTYIWDWRDLNKQSEVFDRGQALSVGLLGPRYVFAELPAAPRRWQPNVIVQDRVNRQTLRQWPFHANWYCSAFVGSPNGRFMGVLLEENNPTGGDTSLGLAGPTWNEVIWVPTKGRMVKLAEDAMAVSNDGRHIAVLGLGDMRALVVADMASRRIIYQRAVPRARSVTFSPDGRVLYAAGHYGIAAMVAASGQPLSTWSDAESRRLPTSVTRIAASPDGRFLAAGTDWPQGNVHLFDARTGKQVAQWPVAGRKTLIEGLAFSTSGTYLATADQDTQKIQIWPMPRPLRNDKPNGKSSPKSPGR